jgi:hypothetical protein
MNNMPDTLEGGVNFRPEMASLPNHNKLLSSTELSQELYGFMALAQKDTNPNNNPYGIFGEAWEDEDRFQHIDRTDPIKNALAIKRSSIIGPTLAAEQVKNPQWPDSKLDISENNGSVIEWEWYQQDGSPGGKGETNISAFIFALEEAGHSDEADTLRTRFEVQVGGKKMLYSDYEQLLTNKARELAEADGNDFDALVGNKDSPQSQGYILGYRARAEEVLDPQFKLVCAQPEKPDAAEPSPDHKTETKSPSQKIIEDLELAIGIEAGSFDDFREIVEQANVADADPVKIQEQFDEIRREKQLEEIPLQRKAIVNVIKSFGWKIDGLNPNFTVEEGQLFILNKLMPGFSETDLNNVNKVWNTIKNGIHPKEWAKKAFSKPELWMLLFYLILGTSSLVQAAANEGKQQQ